MGDGIEKAKFHLKEYYQKLFFENFFDGKKPPERPERQKLAIKHRYIRGKYDNLHISTHFNQKRKTSIPKDAPSELPKKRQKIHNSKAISKSQKRYTCPTKMNTRKKQK